MDSTHSSTQFHLKLQMLGLHKSRSEHLENQAKKRQKLCGLIKAILSSMSVK